jgi:hypothetical protein
VPLFIKKIPKDRFTKKPFLYHPNEKRDHYILYSFGPDEQDGSGLKDSDDIVVE